MLLGILSFILLYQINYHKTKVVLYGEGRSSVFLLMLYPILIASVWFGVRDSAFYFTVSFIISVYAFLIYHLIKEALL